MGFADPDPRLDLRGAQPPVGPSNHPAEARCAQAKKRTGRTRARRPRARLCLLKGCERSFRPLVPQQRYCSLACRQAAACWRRWRAQKKYRTTEKGKQRRQAQSHRRRERIRDRRKQGQDQRLSNESGPAPPLRVGNPPGANSEVSACDRPGCYELFARERRSPLQRFCSCGCRNALRRVVEREIRWGFLHRCRRE